MSERIRCTDFWCDGDNECVVELRDEDKPLEPLEYEVRFRWEWRGSSLRGGESLVIDPVSVQRTGGVLHPAPSHAQLVAGAKLDPWHGALYAVAAKEAESYIRRARDQRKCCGCGALVSQNQPHSNGCQEADKPESQRETRWADPGEV